jgi:uncharacterized lipoprotein YajG
MRFLILSVAVVLGACAFTPHEVPITATAPKVESSVGNGITLALDVLDDRDSLVAGQRGQGMMGADITAPQVVAALERELTEGFEAQGFNVVPANSPADVDFEARLRAFKFFIESGFWTGAENTDVVVAVEAERAGTDYDRVYRSSDETAALFVPGGEAIDQKLNAALSSVLTQIMNDDALITFLARRPPSGT